MIRWLSLLITGAAFRGNEERSSTGPLLGEIECVSSKGAHERTETEMGQVNPRVIRQLLNEGTPVSTDASRLSPSYEAEVKEQLTKYFAGKQAQPGDDEFDLMVADWTTILQDVVPEYRLAEVFVNVRRTRTTTFSLEPSEICGAWQQMKDAEKVLRPTKVSAFAKNVCPDCNGTGTKLVKKTDFDLGREYVDGQACKHENFE